MNIPLYTLILCALIISCTNKPKQEETPHAPINNVVGINDTLGLSLHPEFPVYSTKQKQVTFVLHNNSGTDIGFGGYYSYTYEDEKGIWRDVPMQLVVFDVEYVLCQGNKYYYNAELFRHTPGRYRFFLTVRRYSKEYTLMTEFQLQNNVVEFLKRHPYNQLNDTLSPPEEEVAMQPIYNVIDQMPEYPGDIDKLQYPAKATPLVLQPVPRDIPIGEAINPDSLSMKTEYDYYPLTTTEVKLIITNHSHYEYECGESYSLAYYNNRHKSWETLPTHPIVNDILWIFPSEHPTHEQTIKLYTSEVPNRAGKYRIYKAFNRRSKVAYAEFELVDEAEAKRLRIQMDAAWNGKTISSQNMYGSYMRGDSIFVDLINNSIHFQKLFRKEILNYSAINYGVIRIPSPFTQRAYTDTLQISMKTEKSVYPMGTESVNVILTNKNLGQQTLFFGEYCFVARKQGKQWILLNDNSIVNSVGFSLKPYGEYRFKAKLYPLFNDNTFGQYRVYKEVEFEGTNKKWYMAAEFRIE